MARLRCRFDAALAREQLDDYVRDVEIDVLEFSDDMTEEYLVGRIFMNQILWTASEVDGVSLLDICDNDSQGLYEVYRILTNQHATFRGELKIEQPIHDVLFVYRFILHPDFTSYRCSILDSSVTLFGDDALAVMWKSEGEFSERELAALGFRKIAGEQLIYRQLSFRTPFSDRFPYGQAVQETATADHQSWTLGQVGSTPETEGTSDVYGKQL